MSSAAPGSRPCRAAEHPSRAADEARYHRRVAIVGRTRIRARRGLLVAIAGAFACGPRAPPDEGATGSGGVGSGTGTGSTTSDVGTSGSTGEPPPAVCDGTSICGDGIVEPGEDCDDANADDADGCTADCRRPPPHMVETGFGLADLAAIDVDDSALVVSTDRRTIARIATNGSEVWRQSLGGDGTLIYPGAVLIGEQIIVLGAVSWDDFATVWRFAPDGTPIAVESVEAFRTFGGGVLASDGGLLARADSHVVRLAADGSEILAPSRSDHGRHRERVCARHRRRRVPVGRGLGIDANHPDDGSGHARDSDRISSGFGAPYLEAIVAMPDGGAVAVGDAGAVVGDQVVGSGYFVAVRVDAAGEVMWRSTCSMDGAMTLPYRVAVIDDRIVVAGARSAVPGCLDATCYDDSTVVWMQQLAFDGTVVVTDEPGPLFGATKPGETSLAIGGGPSRGITVLVNDQATDKSALVRFGW